MKRTSILSLAAGAIVALGASFSQADAAGRVGGSSSAGFSTNPSCYYCPLPPAPPPAVTKPADNTGGSKQNGGTGGHP